MHFTFGKNACSVLAPFEVIVVGFVLQLTDGVMRFSGAWLRPCTFFIGGKRMRDFTKEYRDLCFEFYEATAMCNNALQRLPTCVEGRDLLEIQFAGIAKCAEKLRLLQQEELYAKSK